MNNNQNCLIDDRTNFALDCGSVCRCPSRMASTRESILGFD